MSEIFLLNTFVSHLRLSSDIVNDAGETRFLVKINLKNLPTIEIKENCLARKCLPDNLFEYSFDAGEIQYFSMNIDELVKLLRENLLKIGIYRENDTFPLCQVEVPFVGCACNLISNNNSKETMTKDLTINGSFNLLDPGENPSGQVFVNVALINCGRFIGSYYRQGKESFIFKKSLKGIDYEFLRVANNLKSGTPENVTEANKLCNFQEFYDNFIKKLIIVSPSSRYLSKEEESTKTPHISANETGKKKKTKKKQKKK